MVDRTTMIWEVAVASGMTHLAETPLPRVPRRCSPRHPRRGSRNRLGPTDATARIPLPNRDDSAIISALHEIAAQVFRQALQGHRTEFALHPTDAPTSEVPNNASVSIKCCVAKVEQPRLNKWRNTSLLGPFTGMYRANCIHLPLLFATVGVWWRFLIPFTRTDVGR